MMIMMLKDALNANKREMAKVKTIGDGIRRVNDTEFIRDLAEVIFG